MSAPPESESTTLKRFSRIALAIATWRYSMLVLLAGLGTFASLQTYYNSVHHQGPTCPQVSTYRIFKYSHLHLLNGKDLYIDHLDEHCYTFKYSPAFALFFGAFAYLPELPGLWLWIMLSVIVTYCAIQALPGTGPPKRFMFLLFVSLETLLCFQTQQTNAMLAALLLLAFAFLERRNYLWATFFIVLTGFIKIFGFGAFLLYLFYPEKFRLAAYSLLWVVVLALIPLVVVGPEELMGIYESWYGQIRSDHERYAGMSFYGMLGAVFGMELSKTLLLGISLLLLFAPLVQFAKWRHLWFRQLVLAALLIWMVVFNHKAESPSYVIATMGMALWFFSKPRSWPDIVLFLLAFAGVSLVFSDLTPKSFRTEYAYPFHLKALPCFIVWIRVLVELWTRREQTENSGTLQAQEMPG